MLFRGGWNLSTEHCELARRTRVAWQQASFMMPKILYSWDK
jgi:hypothetical protein